ncbi:MAG: hypothetical protein Alpg2KO_27460 [Alphaproteobacteria bacterium]
MVMELFSVGITIPSETMFSSRAASASVKRLFIAMANIVSRLGWSAGYVYPFLPEAPKLCPDKTGPASWGR